MSHQTLALAIPAPRVLALCLATVLLAALIAGCQNGGNGYDNGAAPPMSSATPPMTVPPDSDAAMNNNGMQPATTPDNAMTGSFVAKATTGNMIEIKLGEVALDKTDNADIKNFANQMKTDHTKANQKLKSIADAAGMDVPNNLTAEQQATVNRLQGLNGAAFNTSYIDFAVKNHQKVIALFEDAASHASTPELRQFAAGTLPTLRSHLKMAQSLQSDLANDMAQ